MQDQLIFLLSAPRSGSTLLQRMIGGHSQIYTHPEPHLISPIAHLGYYDNIDKAAFDHVNAAEALKSFVAELPRGEQDYLDALRAYTDIMYGRMLAPTGKARFLDKTPANSLVWPFLTKLYPHAKYLVLTRHPLAVFSSFANSFFDGDWQTAYEFNPVVERYVGALGRMLRERPVPLYHARYEALVKEPAQSLERMFAYCGLENEEGAEEYGKGPAMKKGMGDPIGVQQHDRPVTGSIGKWTQSCAATRRSWTSRAACWTAATRWTSPSGASTSSRCGPPTSARRAARRRSARSTATPSSAVSCWRSRRTSTRARTASWCAR
ncbi:MAG: sulfotransferase [Sandaracinaceae bacterium]|nr:sulfotransferase [Sandaracinaceae bacterium]